MELLLTGLPPVNGKNRTLLEAFEENFIAAEALKIATGYVSSDALAEIKSLLEQNDNRCLDLIIGMHGFEGFTQGQYDGAVLLDEYLRVNSLNEVRVSKTFPFHGKLYSFLKASSRRAFFVGAL